MLYNKRAYIYPIVPPCVFRVDELLKVQVLRLDWQGIPRIENLDSFTDIRELYLQYNNIQAIEELDTLTKLEFLALGSNRIRRLENLRHLRKVRLYTPFRTTSVVVKPHELAEGPPTDCSPNSVLPSSMSKIARPLRLPLFYD